MASKVQIWNLALSTIGANEVSDPDNENTAERNRCETFWDQVVDEVFEAHTWDFAKVFESLAEDSGYTMIDDKYDYAYDLPSSYVRPLEEEYKTNWERREQHILSNESPFVLEYIKRITDESKFPTHFVKAVASLLRVHLSGKLGNGKPAEWLEVYENRDLPQAILADARQSRPTVEDAVKHTGDNDSWVVAAS